MADRLHSASVVNIDDLRRLAERRLPRVVFDYIDGGAEAERTLRENCRVFDDVTFRPRGAVASPLVDLRTTILGHTFELPFLLAPIGSSRMFYPRAEVAAAAAGAAGTGYILSTLSGCALEEVKAATNRSGVVSGVPGRGPRSRRGRDCAREGRGLLRARGDGRYAAGRHARTGHPQRHNVAAQRQSARDGSAPLSGALASAVARRISSRRRPDAVSECRPPGCWSDEVRRPSVPRWRSRW